MSRRFFILDVFTRTALAGNPLAVVLAAEGLDEARMQAIAAEFNLSETVFVFEPKDDRHRAGLRIFTPTRELPFAGHPTIGTAVLLAHLDRAGEPGAVAFGLEETIGVVSCVAEIERADRGHARFRAPALPRVAGESSRTADLARVLGLEAGEVGFGRHQPSRHAAGVAFQFVPVASLDALARARPSPEALARLFGDGPPPLYVYARADASGHGYRARMFAPGLGVREDPATGSAAVAFAGVLMQCEPLGDGEHDVVIEQGIEMGRPSEIGLQAVIRDGALAAVEIAGAAVIVAEGGLRV